MIDRSKAVDQTGIKDFMGLRVTEWVIPIINHVIPRLDRGIQKPASYMIPHAHEHFERAVSHLKTWIIRSSRIMTELCVIMLFLRSYNSLFSLFQAMLCLLVYDFLPTRFHEDPILFFPRKASYFL